MAEGSGYRFKNSTGDGDGGTNSKESKLHNLRSKFPDLDDETLEDMLTQAEGNVDEILHKWGEQVVPDEDAELERIIQEIEAQEASANVNVNGTSDLFEEIRGLSLSQSKAKQKPDLSAGNGSSSQPSFSFGRGRGSTSGFNQAPYPPLSSTVQEIEPLTKWDYRPPSAAAKAPTENYEDFDEALYDLQDSAFRESSDEESEEGDLVSLQLGPNIVEQLFDEYSNPFGNFDVKTLPAKDMKFKMPRKLAFDLYRHICLNLLDKVTEADATTGASAVDDGFGDFRGADDFETTPDLRQIMELEMRLHGEEAKKVEKLRSEQQQNLSLRISMQHLAEVFPSLPKNVLENRFASMNYNYNATVNSLQAEFPQVYNHKANFDVTGDTRDLKDLASNDLTLLKNMALGQYSSESTHHVDQSPEHLRDLANQHYHKGREYDKKLKETYHTRGSAQYYGSLRAEHFKKMEELNKEAMRAIFRRNNGHHKPETQIDLHHLYVKEAMPLLQPFLEMHKHSLRQSEDATLELKIICGKGRHSDVYGPKLLPAVVKYLIANRYSFLQRDGYIIVTLRRA